MTSAPQRFRKRPLEIEAMQITKESARRVAEWAQGQLILEANGRAAAFVVITTLEGPLRAELGDWVIRGIKGEFYPCKPDIFEATYESA